MPIPPANVVCISMKRHGFLQRRRHRKKQLRRGENKDTFDHAEASVVAVFTVVVLGHQRGWDPLSCGRRGSELSG